MGDKPLFLCNTPTGERFNTDFITSYKEWGFEDKEKKLTVNYVYPQVKNGYKLCIPGVVARVATKDNGGKVDVTLNAFYEFDGVPMSSMIDTITALDNHLETVARSGDYPKIKAEAYRNLLFRIMSEDEEPSEDDIPRYMSKIKLNARSELYVNEGGKLVKHEPLSLAGRYFVWDIYVKVQIMKTKGQMYCKSEFVVLKALASREVFKGVDITALPSYSEVSGDTHVAPVATQSRAESTFDPEKLGLEL